MPGVVEQRHFVGLLRQVGDGLGQFGRVAGVRQAGQLPAIQSSVPYHGVSQVVHAGDGCRHVPDQRPRSGVAA
ncbi:hypothetical protein AB0J35_23265 [Nonomuraea angiospora]